jgi:uncharacterized protein
MKARPNAKADRVRIVNRLRDRLAEMTANLLISRTALAAAESERWDKLDRECGYIQGEPTALQYRHMFNTEGIATRIVGVLADESWTVDPETYETEQKRRTAFEREFDRFVQEHDLWYWMHQLDEICGIGQFGVMLIGLDDNRDLESPAEGIDEDGLPTGAGRDRGVTYLMPYDQSAVSIESLNEDTNSRRYGQPLYYRIKQWDVASINESTQVLPADATELRVHWSRVHHLADNCKGNLFLGQPRLRNLHKRVYDIRKILASDGEIWYKGAWPGISFETHPELTESAEFDKESIKEEIEAYASGLQRYVRLIGMTAKSMAPHIADPTNHLMQHYQYIAATLKCPVPVLLGNQTGQLAGENNSEDWNRRLQGRQSKFLNQRHIHPFVRRLQALGVLPRTQTLFTAWRDLNALNDKDKADVALKRTQAVLQYVTSGSNTAIRPFHYLTLILGFSRTEADAIIEACGGEDAMNSAITKAVEMTRAGATPETTGTSPERSTGASGRRNGLGRAGPK